MSDELPELPDASQLTAGEKLVWFGPPGPRGLSGPAGPTGPAGPAGPAGSSGGSMAIGQTVSGSHADGSVLYTDGSGNLAQDAAGGFFYDTTGAGPLTLPFTLYVGGKAAGGNYGSLALWQASNSSWAVLSHKGSTWDFGSTGANFGGAVTVQGQLFPVAGLSVQLSTDVQGLYIQAAATQLNDLVNLAAHASTPYQRVSGDGFLIGCKTTAPDSSTLQLSQWTSWLTATPSAVALNLTAKDSSGTIVTWAIPANLTGPAGAPGPVGPRGPTGPGWLVSSGPPAATQGNIGDSCLQTGSGDPGRIWQKTAPYFGVPPLWQQQGTLNRGAQGPMGARGQPGPAGPTGPAGPAGSNASATNPILGSFNGKLAQASTTSVTIGPGPGWANWQAILQDGSGNTLKVDSSSTLTISTGATGANGIDSGSQASSTWYYLWVISTGTVTAGLISTSKTAPTLPNGYTYKQLLGAVFSDGSTHLVAFTQIGNRVWVVRQNVFSSQAASLANTYQSQSVSSIVPDIARVAYGMQGNSVTANGTGNAIAADSSGTGEQICFVNVSTSNTALDNFFMAGNFQIPLLTAQTFWWKASTTSAANRIDITGWEY